MRKSSTLFAALCIAAACQVRAEEPTAVTEKAATPAPAAVAQSPEKDKAAAPTEAPTEASKAADAAKADAAKAAADEAAAAKARDKRFMAMGYKPTQRDGVTMYCRKETVLGTRFSRIACATPETIERTAENAQAETDRMVRRSLYQPPSN